jgi:5-methylthioadenosine/S-adenosylhomocysteine deaminase
MDKLILENCSLLDEEGNCIGNKNLLISNGIIKRISSENLTEPENVTSLDCSQLVITPGFVNLHTHSPMNIFKGIAEDVNELDWFNKEIWPYESKMDREDVYAGSRLAIAEMLHKGVTAFADHYFEAEMICKAVLETGIRGDIAPTLFGMAGAFDDQLHESAQLIRNYGAIDKKLSLRFGPHSPYTCSPEDLEKTSLLAQSMGKGIHLHVSDGEKQIQSSLDLYGRTPFQILTDTGVMKSSLIVGHGLWILDEELEEITDKTWFAVCPGTYMKLSAGMGRIWRWHKKLPLCIGTDGAASSSNLDPLAQLRLFLLIGKFNLNNAEDFTLKEGWKMLMRGHEALDFHSGKIKEGYAADLLFWDLNHINTLPLYNPLASIIYSSGPENIRHSMINGQFVKKDGNVNLDLDEIKKHALERVQGILRKGKGKTKLVF